VAVEGGTLLRTSLPGNKLESKVTAIVFDDGTVTVCGLGQAGAMGDLTPAQALQEIGTHAARNSQMTLPVLKEIVTPDGAAPPRIKQHVYG
jgi:D-arabinose 5-phosphate isomerase GutQ